MATAADLQSLADAPNTRREFETIYVLRPNTSNDGVAEVNNRVRGIIEERGGKVLKVDNWGKRRLAYEVKKERKGIYLYWQYLAAHGTVEEVERNMRMLDHVLRFMTIKLDKDIDPNARPSEVTDESYEQAANTAADEEDMYIRSSAEGEGKADEEGEGESEDEAKSDEAKSDEAGEAKETAEADAEEKSEDKTEASDDAEKTDSEDK